MLPLLFRATAAPSSQPGPTPASAPPPDAPPPVWVWEVAGSSWATVGQVDSYESLSMEIRYNQPGLWSMRVAFNVQALLLQKKRLITVNFRGERFTGLVETIEPQSDETGKPVLEVSGRSALALLGDVCCYPDPNSGAAAQLAARYRATGPAETVLRSLIVANVVTRRGDSLSIPASSGRGADTTVNLFFDNLLEVVTKKARRAGLGVTMGLVGAASETAANMQLSFSVPADRSDHVHLSHDVGTLRSWKQSDTVPTGTTAVVLAAIRENPHVVNTVNLTADTMSVTGDSHQLKTGSLLRLRGLIPDPLDDGTTYHAIRVDADTFKVAKTRAKALDGTAVDITDVGLRVESVNTTTNAITVTSGDLPKNDAPFRILGPGNAPNPLTKDTTYYAIKVDRNTLKVSNSPGGSAITLTTTGSGELRIFEVGALKVVEISRLVREVSDTTAESEWGRRIETVVDARDEDGDDESIFSRAGHEALDDTAEQSSFDLESIEVQGMRYGEDVTVGDMVKVVLMSGVSSVERLTAAKVEVGSDGLKVQLVPGNPDAGNPMFKQAAIIRNLRARIRNLEQEDS